MANYAANNLFSSAQNLGALVASAKSIIVLTATSGSLRRGKLYDYTISANGAYASTDTNIEHQIIRQTAAGTATSGTPNPLDPADVAALTTFVMNATVEGTTGLELDHFAFNQRATYRWSAVPGSELVWPATAANGLALRAFGQSGGYASTVMYKALFIEQ
jgi:hypothetical protein